MYKGIFTYLPDFTNYFDIIDGMNSSKYGGIIWTNHALERLDQRGLSQDIALQTFRHPDKTNPGKNYGTTEYQKTFGPSLVTIIAKPNERGEWIVLSNWIDPPLPGTEDFKKQQDYRKYRRAPGWIRFFLDIKKQLGL